MFYNIEETKHNSFKMFTYISFGDPMLAREYLNVYLTDLQGEKVLTIFSKYSVYNFKIYWDNVIVSSIDEKNN